MILTATIHQGYPDERKVTINRGDVQAFRLQHVQDKHGLYLYAELTKTAGERFFPERTIPVRVLILAKDNPRCAPKIKANIRAEKQRRADGINPGTPVMRVWYYWWLDAERAFKGCTQ
jgi:hypothetical protein